MYQTFAGIFEYLYSTQARLVYIMTGRADPLLKRTVQNLNNIIYFWFLKKRQYAIY